MSNVRQEIVLRAFRSLDVANIGKVPYQNLLKAYNAGKHPDVKSGK
jgi:hypothetical protein